MAAVLACIERNPRKPGARRLWLARGNDVTLSALEDGFVALLRQHGLPLARTNVDVARRRRSDHVAFTCGDVFERATQTVQELARAIECRQRGA